MAERFAGNAAKMRKAAVAAVARALGIELERGQEAWGLVLALIPDLGRWTAQEKRGVARILLAKTGPDESRYLRLMAGHRRLRQAVLELGV
jgi:hypothetical protein